MKAPNLREIVVSKNVAMCSLFSFLLLMSGILHIIRETDDREFFGKRQKSICLRTRILLGEHTANADHTNFWFPIPDWLAGTWQAGSETILDAYDYQLGRQTISEPVLIETAQKSIIGMQQDNQGRIWYCACTPYKREVETNVFVDHQTIESINVMVNSANQLTVECLAVVVRFGKPFGEQQKVFQEETVTTYSPLDDGSIQVNFLINDFDMERHPLISSRAVCYERRIDSFQAVDQDERGDIKKKFQDFLIANGLGYLWTKNQNFMSRSIAQSGRM